MKTRPLPPSPWMLPIVGLFVLAGAFLGVPSADGERLSIGFHPLGDTP